MPVYRTLGAIPPKRHQVWRKPDGELHAEELIGNMGFTGPSSLLYHLHPPTRIKNVRNVTMLRWEAEEVGELKHRHFRTRLLGPGGGCPVLYRVPVLFNKDVALCFVRPSKPSQFYRNAQGDEVVYISDGAGQLQSLMGTIRYRRGDYVVIPRGILHRWVPDEDAAGPQTFLIIESAGYVRTPKRYRNEYGQLLESAPYSERDFRTPESLQTFDETGDFSILVKKDNRLTEMVVAHHPFDVAGWDGCYYPYAFNIHDFEPRVGRFHLPPPVHQTFESDGFVICSFCPRPYDFDPQAVPAPYNHSNVMSDEVLYYANSEFMSRKGIEYGSITLHPDGLPHGPHPGRTEDSIGKTYTDELAVMVDTFRGLKVAKAALAVEDKEYFQSWL